MRHRRFRTTLHPATLLSVTLLSAALLAAIALGGCKSSIPSGGDSASPSGMPPNPTSIINGTRDKLAPFRFTLATSPAQPSYTAPFALKVHVIDATGQPAEGLTVKADVTMSGMSHGEHITLDDQGHGDYEGRVSLEMAGSWDVDLSASKGDKTGQQKLSIEVGS